VDHVERVGEHPEPAQRRGAQRLAEQASLAPEQQHHGGKDEIDGQQRLAPRDGDSGKADERQFEEVEASGSYLWILGTIGSSAPFIGLFGTVVGIMRAFHSMALVGTGGFGVVAGGISEALIATALGLAIGIVSLVFYNYLQNRVERIDGALRIGSARLLEAVAAARRAHGAV